MSDSKTCIPPLKVERDVLERWSERMRLVVGKHVELVVGGLVVETVDASELRFDSYNDCGGVKR